MASWCQTMSESQLWSSLHERLAGTPGADELVELQRRVTPLFSLAEPIETDAWDRSEDPFHDTRRDDFEREQYAADEDGDLIPFVDEREPLTSIEDNRGVET